MHQLLQQIFSGLAVGAIYGSVALALVMIYRATDLINFAQGEMAMFSTYIAWTLVNAGLPFWAAFVITLAVSFLGGMTIDVQQARAVAQTKMTISQRGLVHDVLVDVVCAGRFYDFLERRDGRWGIVRRQPIYEIDRMDPVDPAASLRLDAAVLGAYPEGYRHLAYLQRGLGFDVKAGLPERTGAAVEQLYAQGRAWLSGDPSLFKNQDPSFRTVAADSGRSANPAQPLAGGDGPLRQRRRPGGDVLRWWRSRRPGRSERCRRPRRRYG